MRQVRCPRCGALPGRPCTNAEGLTLDGTHFQRTGPARTAIQAALSLYAPLDRRQINAYKNYP